MKLLFKKKKPFLVVFLIVLLVDLVFTNIDYLYDYRYITKPWIVITLALHFYYNCLHLLPKERLLVFLALALSLVADFILITDSIPSLITGMSMFILAKICYTIIFSFKARFDIDRLLPFLAVVLLYCLFIIYYVYDGLGELVIPVVVYIFVTLTMAKMAYLRYNMVNKESYYFVMAGAIFFIISETIMGFYNFYKPLPYTYTSVLLTYGLSQFFTIRGIILQNEKML